MRRGVVVVAILLALVAEGELAAVHNTVVAAAHSVEPQGDVETPEQTLSAMVSTIAQHVNELAQDARSQELLREVLGRTSLVQTGSPAGNFTQQVPTIQSQYETVYNALMLALVIIFGLTNYDKLIDDMLVSAQMDHWCRINRPQVEGFDTVDVMVTTTEEVPKFTPRVLLSLRSGKRSPKDLLGYYHTAYRLSPEEPNDPVDGLLGAVVTPSHTDSTQGKIFAGDVIVRVGCEYVRHSGSYEDALLKFAKKIRETARLGLPGLKIRIGLTLTVLRPKKDGKFCSLTQYMTPDGYCCWGEYSPKVCAPENRYKPITFARYTDQASHPLLAELWHDHERQFHEPPAVVGTRRHEAVEHHAKAPPKDLEEEEEEEHTDTDTDANTNSGEGKAEALSHSDGDNKQEAHSEQSLSPSKANDWTVWDLALGTFRRLSWLFYYTVGLGFTYHSLVKAMNEKTTTLWPEFQMLLVLGVLTLAYAMFRFGFNASNHLRAHQLSVWAFALCVILPAYVFVRARNEGCLNCEKEAAVFTTVSTFLGLMLSSLVVVDATFKFLRSHGNIPVPDVLSGDVGELMVGAASVALAVEHVWSESRTLHGNGGVCLVSDLKKDVAQIELPGVQVGVVCEDDKAEMVNAGVTCTLRCGSAFSRPVRCMPDYPIIGGLWSLTYNNQTATACCHEAMCAPGETYCADQCSNTSTGCRVGGCG